MDSSQTNSKKPPLVIGGMADSGGTNPKFQSGAPDSTLGDGFSNPGLKRDSRNYENDDDDINSLSTKKPRTTTIGNTSQGCQKIVPLDVKPLTIVPPETPKLSRQFWKAGEDDESVPLPHYCSNDAAVRVHPQFLHANATSHKWALGALAELLDNSLDEVNNGATYVHVNTATNERDGKSNILIVEDNGGGMNPSTFRECLSLGYSRKRNMANRVGQYGNGFKTSTMRLGADAIVFSRCRGTNGNNPTQSIGMLSYTFLYETRKCEAIVPTVDYELVNNEWKEIVYNSRDEWSDNLETIMKWSPYLSEQDLLDQFDHLEEQGTRIVIYNLWEDDEGKLELDFDTDPHDIQLRGVNRDEKNIEMAKANPNSRHFLSYRHSLRSYASILYLERPSNFRIILRGKDVQHHSILDDMMMMEEKTYKPMRSPEWSSDQAEMCATIKLGFVKDARHHIDIQGFNVYHKNRLIKPFWRVWTAAGSDGRGVIGILEANFIQPAHNKQGFERTAVLAKLEGRFDHLEEQGTRIVIYNLWEDDEGKLELDFDTDPHDIQLRGVNRDEKNIEMAKANPNSRHFLSYRHSLRSYASILYLERPSNFRIILRGKDVQHHSILDDMMMMEEKTYKPMRSPEWSSDQAEMCATIKLGFVKDARHHIDIQGFNVYHKNRLIKPFWRVWTAAGSDGRGVIGILEANFIQPAHNKQGFERTAVLAKLEGRLIHHQKQYWSSRCQEIGYAPRRKQKSYYESNVTETTRPLNKTNLNRGPSPTAAPAPSRQNVESFVRNQNTQVNTQQASAVKIQPEIRSTNKNPLGRSFQETGSFNLEAELQKVKQKSAELVSELQREKAQLQLQLEESKAKIQNLENRQEGVNKIFHEERARRDVTENALRKRLREASDEIDGLKRQVETFKGKHML
ncbi:PREDICTED: protein MICRORCHIDIA 5-like [Camelina sativa]|uniref:Protein MICRORCHIDIA 5-like n=1 Tax=Camelina sativa TaxID=90675 RepID=A0ABM0VAJ8_CAMSA|nr:PREDICTED: protein MICRORCHIDIA 5-like [Camelina sativa]